MKKLIKKSSMISDKEIEAIAYKAGLPTGWYNGPWFDGNQKLRTGMAPCMRRFVKLIVEHSNK